MRRLTVFFALVLLGLALIPGAAAQEQDELVALEVVARLNAWRLDEGLAPLKPNPILTAMALDQARYVLSLDDFPDDPHIGSRGLGPRQRALVDPFNWPDYGRTDRVNIGENAAQGSVNFAFNFWASSALHRNTALNPAYREVGVAALPHENGYFFIAVFGSRPDVLPALLDPRDSETIYLSSEEYQFSNTADSIQAASEIQLFDGDGRPLLDTPETWTGEIIVPESARDTLYVLVSDGEHEVLSAVDLETDRVILPDYLPVVVADSAGVAVEPTPVPTEAPSEVPTEVTEAPTLEPTETATVEPTPAPTATPAPPAASMQLRYTSDTLDLINVSGSAADWTGMSFEGAISFPFTQFQRVTEFPLEALPANHCLQIRDVTISGAVVLPDDCGWVRSLIQISTSRIFWNQPFDVLRNGEVITTCDPNAGVCDISLG